MHHVNPSDIELKSADDADANAIVTKALADLTGTVEAKLKDIETKSAARMDAIEARIARPAVITGDKAEAGVEMKSFISFARRGVERMQADEIKALTVANDASAGYLAPEQFAAEILKKTVEFSPIRAYAKVMTISAAEIKFPRKVTGTVATWTAESADRTGSEPSFEQISLAPHELATFSDVSTALLEDAMFDIEGYLAGLFAEDFGAAEGSAFVNGNGTGRPKGLLQAAGMAEINTGKADGFLAASPADVLIRAYHGLPTVHAQNGVWIMNRTTLGTIRTWKDSMGRYLVVEPISAGMPTTLLGRPIVEAVDMPDIAAGTTPIVFGDLSAYRIVDRIGLSVLRDPFSIALKGQVRFHARKRVGADITNPDRFIKIKVAV